MKNTMTAAGISAAILAGGLTTSSLAVADVSANIGVTSNYVWRGASQTGNGPAVQGGIDYESEIGIYVGTWASNVNFGDTYADGEYELDGYFGWGMGFTDNVGLDLSYVYYHYGQLESGSDFGEFIAKVNLWWFELGGAYTTNDQKDKADSNTEAFVAGDYALWGALNVPIGESWSIGLTIGQYTFDNDGVTQDLDYAWGQLDATRSMEEYGDIKLSVSQASEEADGNDNPKVFISWTKGF